MRSSSVFSKCIRIKKSSTRNISYLLLTVTRLIHQPLLLTSRWRTVIWLKYTPKRDDKTGNWYRSTSSSFVVICLVKLKSGSNCGLCCSEAFSKVNACLPNLEFQSIRSSLPEFVHQHGTWKGISAKDSGLLYLWPFVFCFPNFLFSRLDSAYFCYLLVSSI